MNINSYISFLNDFQHSAGYPESIERVYKEVPGFSSRAVMTLLHTAVNHMDENETYLEVGTYRGRTLIGAMLNTNKTGLGIDNFSEFATDPEAHNEEIQQRLKTYFIDDLVSFFPTDYRKVRPQRKVGVYFYDGNHDTDQGLEGLEYMVPFLADKSVILIDDLSGEGVWKSVVMFANKHIDEARVLFSMHTNNFPNPHSIWWNGIIILGWRKDRKFR